MRASPSTTPQSKFIRLPDPEASRCRVAARSCSSPAAASGEMRAAVLLALLRGVAAGGALLGGRPAATGSRRTADCGVGGVAVMRREEGRRRVAACGVVVGGLLPHDEGGDRIPDGESCSTCRAGACVPSRKGRLLPDGPEVVVTTAPASAVHPCHRPSLAPSDRWAVASHARLDRRARSHATARAVRRNSGTDLSRGCSCVGRKGVAHGGGAGVRVGGEPRLDLDDRTELLTVTPGVEVAGRFHGTPTDRPFLLRARR